MRAVLALHAILLLAPMAAGQGDMEQSQLSALLSSDTDEFPKAVAPRTFDFPEDHGPHPEFRNEWWYMTGNLEADNERRFGFELTIFRFAVAPNAPASDSVWRTNQIYIAHFAVTDADGQRFFVAERFSRGARGLAGAAAMPFRVWIDDWEIAAGDGDTRTWSLRANDDEFAIDLRLVANRAPVLNGIDGLSQKSAATGNASYYYSITRWQSDGRLRIGDDEFMVSGLSWLDREWSSSALAADQQGWDWFALQLSDGSDLMFYNLRKTDGSQDSHSAGTWISAGGKSRHLDRNDVVITVIDRWQSPQGGTYPSRWEVSLAAEELDVVVTPVLEDQELFTTVRYWEGAVDVVGTRFGKAITGRGYVELTGYAR